MAYSVTSRILSLEEKTILFGKKLAQDLLAIKATDLDNYLGMFKAFYEGEAISIPGLEDNKGFRRVYIYCDLPVGSRYFSESVGRYDSKYRDEVYGTPFPYVKCEINDFLVPIMRDALSVFGDVSEEQARPDHYYAALNSHYRYIHESLLASCFINVFDDKCVSISTYHAISDLYAGMNLGALRQTASASVDDLEAAWYYTHFLVPPEVGRNLVEYSPSKEFISKLSTYFQETQRVFIQNFSSLFSWTSGNAAQNVVFAQDYVKYNGYYKFNEKRYMGIGWTGNSPLTEHSGHSPMSALTASFEQYLFGDLKTPNTLSSFFGFTDSSNRNRYNSNRGSFLLINKAAISTAPVRIYSGVPELIELDKEFFGTITQTLKDEETTNGKLTNGDAAEKFRKREFAIKRETLLNMSEVENSRYITVQNADSKLFVLTKTSKAKEAARKMSITRKISAAVEPVIDMAIRIFAAADFETGITEPEFRFMLNSKTIYDALPAALDAMPKVSTWLDNAVILAQASYLKFNPKTATDVIKRVYETVNYEGTPFLDWKPMGTVTRSYRDNFLGRNLTDQETLVLGYAYGAFISNVASQNAFTGLYSPSSGMLNLVNLGYNLYSNAHLASFPKELIALKSVSHGYRSSQSFTGVQCHHLYVNNFIGDNQALSDSIEARKNDTWVGVSTNLVTAITAFTFSQDAVDTLAILKKCKTFKDYSTWFNNVKPILEDKLENTVLVNDAYARKACFVILSHFGDLLERLATEEAPFLPKEEEKKRGRKKKEDAEESETEEASSDNKETTEVSAAILAALKGES